MSWRSYVGAFLVVGLRKRPVLSAGGVTGAVWKFLVIPLRVLQRITYCIEKLSHEFQPMEDPPLTRAHSVAEVYWSVGLFYGSLLLICFYMLNGYILLCFPYPLIYSLVMFIL